MNDSGCFHYIVVCTCIFLFYSISESILYSESVYRDESWLEDVIVDTSTYNLYHDIHLSDDRTMSVQCDCTLNGKGHRIDFARNCDGCFQVADGATTILNNVVLHDFSLTHVGLGTNSNLIFGDNTFMELVKNEDLATTLTFSGSCTINGNGHVLDLGDTGNIVVDGAGSSLLFDNITLRGVKWFNVCCLDDTATISFGNVTMVLDEQYAFTTGHIDVIGKLALRGAQAFYLASEQSSEIWSYGELILEDDIIFRYEPPTSNRDLLKMENSKAVLHLNGATLSSSTTGLRLTKGTLVVDNMNYTINQDVLLAYDDIIITTNDGSALSEGICLGSSAGPGNDLFVKTMPGSSINVYSGLLVYDNII